MIMKKIGFRSACATMVIASLVQLQMIPATAEENVVALTDRGQANQRQSIMVAATTGSGGIKPGSIMVINESGVQTTTLAQWNAKPASMTLSPGGFCLVR